jgi:DNA-binding MarR family transcriptional regulator
MAETRNRAHAVEHTRSLPDIDYRALAELRHQIRCFLVFSEREARAAGIEPQQHQLLLALKGLAPGSDRSIRVIAERLQLKHHTVVGLVDRLCAAGLVVRSRSEADARSTFVQITRKGERLLRGLSLAHSAELKTAGPALLKALQTILTEDARRPRGELDERSTRTDRTRFSRTR